MVKSTAELFVEKKCKYKAVKHNYSNSLRQLRYDASREFRAVNKSWFQVLDSIGILLIIINFGALFITGVLAVKAEPSKGFAEANPVQCVWNGWSCHTNYLNVIIPMLKQIFVWAILVGLYIYVRNNTFNITGLWILTFMIIFYLSALALDFNNDLGLYIGKVVFGK